MTEKRPAVLVFRKQILPYSETFIADQGRFLDAYTPYFVGFTHNASGEETLLQGTHRMILADYAGSLEWAKLRHRLGLVANRKWLDGLKQVSPKLIHAHFAKDAIDAMALSRQLNIPFVATVHGYDITHSNESRRYARQREKMFHSAAKIIAVSDYIKSRLIEKNCPADKIVQHYIGIDVDKFTGIKSEAEVPTILFIGRLVEKKGCGYLLDALAGLADRYPDLVLNIVGNGPLEDQLRKKSAQLKFTVNFLGRKSPEEIKALMLNAWVFSTPSITAENGDAEGLGMVFLEAQALQTPVVSFASGGVVEAVEHGVTGLLSEERDADSLARNIGFFLEDKERRVQFGNNGRSRVMEKFNIVEQCKKLSLIYQSVTG